MLARPCFPALRHGSEPSARGVLHVRVRRASALLARAPPVSNVQTLFHPNQPRYLLLKRWLRQEQPSHLGWVLSNGGSVKPVLRWRIQTAATWGFSRSGWHRAPASPPIARFGIALELLLQPLQISEPRVKADEDMGEACVRDRRPRKGRARLPGQRVRSCRSFYPNHRSYKCLPRVKR